ncbi:MAG: ergothioneine biosynthesis protein EgtB [Gammaproteobacteria bacterium]|nr:ergothioneine biosynthesis protein EgtB [Gammaproteobacteria bacterium]
MDARPKTPLRQRYRDVRQRTESLCAPLEIEDYVAQSMADASPVKWHLAHTTWFFETFLLQPNLPDYQLFSPGFDHLFNSYYNAVGPQYPRPQRGLISRPTVRQVFDYRQAVDEAMARLIDANPAAVTPLIELGLHHEQQHQELLLTDLKHLLWQNPLYPAYQAVADASLSTPGQSQMITCEGGETAIGYSGSGFHFDNEAPAHRHRLPPFALASHPVSNRQYLEFMQDGGYSNPLLWLSDGWQAAQQQQWQAPLYWLQREAGWQQFTLGGLLPVALDAPVCHISYYEADAFARWAGQRLPTEFEWEAVAREVSPASGHFADRGIYQPHSTAPEAPATPYSQLYGDVWEWTASPYQPYPGYHPAEGAVGEYNGKFMCNQLILRGGSCATAEGHIRPSYRNFFYPESRWQFSGMRLAGNL